MPICGTEGPGQVVMGWYGERSTTSGRYRTLGRASTGFLVAFSANNEKEYKDVMTGIDVKRA